MRRDLPLYLQDILNSIDLIQEWVQGVSKENFLLDYKLQNAIIFELIKIGEACANIPQNIREKYPKIPWKSVVGMRNNLIHEYFGISEILVWETINLRLLPLKEVIQDINKSSK